MTFGERLKRYRKSAGLTMKELGEKCGIAESTVSGYENGIREPDFNTLISISTVLEVSIDYLVKGDGEKENTFGGRLKSLRDSYKLTQPELAKKLKVSLSTIKKMEQGERETSFSNLIELSKIFNVTTDYLLGLSEKEV